MAYETLPSLINSSALISGSSKVSLSDREGFHFEYKISQSSTQRPDTDITNGTH